MSADQCLRRDGRARVQGHPRPAARLHQAVERGDREVAKLLLETEDGRSLVPAVVAKGSHDRNPITMLHVAARWGHSELVTLLLQRGPSKTWTLWIGSCIGEWDQVDITRSLRWL